MEVDVVCDWMSHVDTLGGDLTWTLVSGRPRATLHGVSCPIPVSRVVCDLNAQVAHEGSSYVECARGVGMVLTGLDVMSSAGLNTW